MAHGTPDFFSPFPIVGEESTSPSIISAQSYFVIEEDPRVNPTPGINDIMKVYGKGEIVDFSMVMRGESGLYSYSKVKLRMYIDNEKAYDCSPKDLLEAGFGIYNHAPLTLSIFDEEDYIYQINYFGSMFFFNSFRVAVSSGGSPGGIIETRVGVRIL